MTKRILHLLNRKRILCMIVAMMTLVAMYVHPFAASAEPPSKVVKVGYMEGYGIDTVNNVKQGYIYDYLMEIARYTGWKYEFVPVTIKEGFDKLESGKIDLFGPLSYKEDRAKKFAFPDNNFGYEHGMLITNDDNDNLYYNDFAAFIGKKIGHLANCKYFSQFQTYATKNHFSSQYKDYPDMKSLVKGLRSKEVDAAIIGSLSSDIDNTKVIAKFSINDTFMIVGKENKAVLNTINSAMSKLKIDNIYLDSELSQKYNSYRSEHIAFTREEQAYIKDHNKLRVVYDPDYSPVGYYDKKQKAYRGISADVMKLISDVSGLEFEYIKTKNYEESIKYIEAGKADVLAGYTDVVESKSFLRTQPYVEIPAVMIGKVDSRIKPGYTIALPAAYKTSLNYIKEKYADAKITLYKNVDDCIDALDSGKADATIVNSYKYANILKDSHGDEYRMLGISGAVLSLGVGVSTQIDPHVQPIINKTITNITTKQMDEIIFYNTIGMDYKTPWSKIVKQYSFEILIFISLLFSIIVLAIILANKRIKKNLKKIAYTDTLTGERNLEKFRIDVTNTLNNSKSEEYSILYFDVEKFKHINEAYGFEIGNEVLKFISKCFSSCLTSEDVFGRSSADYFVAFIKERNQDVITSRVEEVYKRIKAFREEKNKPIRLSMRCGVYNIMPGETDISSLMDKANEARRSLKKDIGKNIAFYTDDMHERILKEKLIEESMHSALENDDFQVYLQPKYDIAKHQIAGAEALVRWQHREEGMMSPFEFIPIFERNGFIIDLDFYVFEKVCQKMNEWMSLGYEITPISVNISRVHLGEKDFICKLTTILNKYQIPPNYIELELTESTFTENIDSLISIMKDLKKAGFLISMDDFGTGFSSLNLLKVLPIDILKLDKSFLDRKETTTKEEILVADVVRMAHHLEIKVVAEGVEKMKQAAFLKSINCDLAQGYVYARPMPIEDFEKLAFGSEDE